MDRGGNRLYNRGGGAFCIADDLASQKEKGIEEPMGDLTKRILFIHYEDRMLEYVLPGYDDRKVRINLFEKTGIKNFELSLEVWDGVWYITSNSRVRISQNHQVVREARLEPGSIFNGKIYDGEFRFQIRAAALGKEQTEFIKYSLRGRKQIEIGQDTACHIVLSDSHVSRRHAFLFYRNGQWFLEDQSKNGTFLNGKKVGGAAKVHYGDQIGIMDYQFLFLGELMAVNHAGSVISRLEFWDKSQISQRKPYPKKEYFFRAPRFMEPLDVEEVELEAPPVWQEQEKMPAWLTIGPSLTMPIPILLMVLFQIAVAQSSGGGNSPVTYFGMVISVALFSALGIMWTMLRRKYEEDRNDEKKAGRERAYLSYITQNEELLEQKAGFNRRVLEKLYLSSEELLLALKKNPSSLWNRNINHEDFLTIRTGIGPMRLPNEIKTPKQRFSVENDPLTALPRQVREKHELLRQTPKLLDLKGHKIIGVVGEETFLYHFSNSMIVQAAALHSYQDLKMVFVLRPGRWEREWDYVKWLPHAFGNEKKLRYIANSDETWERVQQELISEIKFRQEQEGAAEGGKKKRYAQYLIFITDRERINHSMLYPYMVSDRNFGFTFVLLYGRLGSLPNECLYILENTRRYQGAYRLDESIGKSNMAQFEGVGREAAGDFARMLNAYVLPETGQGGLAESIDYLSMIGIGKVEQWDLLKHYKENRSYEGIRARLGVMPGDRPMYLDIHEKKHGPHGLIAGTTGSGKSELIQTFILSLALNYHPSEVAFILIDYKGGGMAKIFEGMPHVAGMILNLNEEGEDGGVDRNQTRRTLMSIRSELKRREQIFNHFRVNHIDDYMRLYREGRAKEALPHLIIISDEFAELKKEQPEFIKELVSTARVGRSIGVHLILATQKPAGVVDDQIFSNSRFKICLRVQDKSDSNEMLKRPEAAYLSTTGRAYFQLGNNEIFELFQSGYSGAVYEPKEEAASADDDEAVMIGIDGFPAASAPKKREKDSRAAAQIDACIAYIKEMAKSCAIIPAKPLWLPPLPKKISVKELWQMENPKAAQGSIRAAAGLLDNPEQQAQYPLWLDFSSFANLAVVGNQGCGKSTLVQTILYGLVTGYGPSEVNTYIFDFSSGLLKNFELLPHCGKAALLEEEDAVNRTFSYLLKEMKERSRKFKEAGVGSFWEYKKIAEEPMPLIIFVIDNYFAFSENYEKKEDDFITILRGGQRTGIQTIVAVNRINDMKFRLRQNFTKMLPLQLNERMDYSEILGGTLDGFSTSVKGRGLCREEEIYEFQSALASEEETEFGRVRALAEEFKEIAQKYKAGAKKIHVIPEDERYKDFLGNIPKEDLAEGVPLGYEQEEIEPYLERWKDIFCYLVSGVAEEGVRNVLMNFLEYFTLQNRQVYYVSLLPNPLKADCVRRVYKDEEDIFQMLLLLKEQFTARNQWRKRFLEEHGEEEMYDALLKEFEPMYFVMDDFGAFIELIYKSHGKESYFPITELFFREGRGLGIWFIAGMETGKSASAAYTLAYKNFTKQPRGICLGGQLNTQKLFQFSFPISLQAKRLEDNIGCLMENGRPIRVVVPWNRKRER